MIVREIGFKLTSWLFRGKILIVFGPRQAGKTTFVEQQIAGLDKRIARFNGDEADVREYLSNTTSAKLKALIGDAELVFIDEAQRIPNVGLTLKLFADQLKHVQVIASGSSSFELAHKANEPLTGRKYEFFMPPLSFSEMVKHHGLLEERRMLGHRLVYGYYPEIVVEQNEANELLRLLVSSYLYKDLTLIPGVNKPYIIDKILRALALQLGSEVKYSELAQLVGVDNQTVERYIDMLEKAFVVFRLPALSRNSRNEIKKGKKIYFYDNGVRNAIIGNFHRIDLRTDVGALWENFLMSERFKYLNLNNLDKGRYFWRSMQQQEIDYVEEENERYSAYEFKWSATAKGHFSATFRKGYPVDAMEVITPQNFEAFIGV